MHLPSATIPLTELPLGQQGIVRELRADKRVRRRLYDLGLIADTVIEALCQSPSGDPTAYHFRGAVIAFRAEEAAAIMIENKSTARQQGGQPWD